MNNMKTIYRLFLGAALLVTACDNDLDQFHQILLVQIPWKILQGS